MSRHSAALKLPEGEDKSQLPVTPMWITGKPELRNETFAVRDPYRGSVVGYAPMASEADVTSAIERMSEGPIPAMARSERAGILRRMARSFSERRDECARLATRESGLSFKDTHYEIGRVMDALELAADATSFDDSNIFAGDVGQNGKARRIFTHREPIGLIAAITPFNHPFNQIVHKVAPAIAANAPIILKPSEKTPLSAFLFAEIAHGAGLPGRMLSIITGDRNMIARVFTTHPAVKLLTFTGSPGVGKALAQAAGYRRVVMELGGNDPLIVLPDADVERAAMLATGGAFGNSGQRCTAVKRILVHHKLADDFVAALAAHTRNLRAGDPLDPTTDVGTVIDEAAAREIESRAQEAAALGAEVVIPLTRDGALLTPSIYDRVAPTARLVVQETFGPIAPVIRFETLDEAITITNSTAYGLSAGICTDRLDWITRCAAELKVGGMNVWEVPGYRSELSPFGGIKDSGLGQKEGIHEAIKLYTLTKTVSIPWG
jgi:putative phosphonoacetaldehyde dehydrogenase